MKFLALWSLPLCLLLALMQGCKTASPSSEIRAEIVASGNGRLAGAQSLITEGKAEFVRETLLTPIMIELAEIERKKDTKFLCARSTTESLFYLISYGTVEGTNTVVLDYDYALAYYLSAYIFVEEGNFEAAIGDLRKALSLSPRNSIFLAELGHVYQTVRNWPAALEVFAQAEEASEGFSPDSVKDSELGRALRGQGFSLIELHRLEEAEAVFERCLEINPKDEKARNELRYIDQLRKRA